jgi:hypothetical protein
VRDPVFGEDETRSKDLRLNANLALLRIAALRVRAELLPKVSSLHTAEKAHHEPAFVFLPVVHHRSQ